MVLTQHRKEWYILGLAMLLSLIVMLSACAGPPAFKEDPVRITEVKTSECDGCLLIAWTTSAPTLCNVQVCTGKLCYTIGDEPEPGKLHTIYLPKDFEHITLIIPGDEGVIHSVPVK